MTAPATTSRSGEGEAPGRDPNCPSTGRHGTAQAYNWDRCRCPAARRAHTARRTRQRMADHSGGLLPAAGTQRRLRALAAIGWDQASLADRLGVSDRAVQDLLRRGGVRRETADRVRLLYAALSGTPGPNDRAARAARRAGHPPPLAWDGTAIDDPASSPALWWLLDAGRLTTTRCALPGCAALVPPRHRYCGHDCAGEAKRATWRANGRSRRAAARAPDEAAA